MKVEVVERQVDVVEAGNVGAVEVSEVVVTRTVEVAAGHVEAHESADDPHGDRAHTDAHQFGSLSTFNLPAVISGSQGVSTNNSALFSQVYAWRDVTVARFIWFAIGNAGGRTYEVGIYNDAGVRLWKAGGTWPTVNSNKIEVVSPALALERGRVYWLAIAAESISDSFSFLGHNFGFGLQGLNNRSLARMLAGLTGSTLPATVDLAAAADSQRGPYVRLTE